MKDEIVKWVPVLVVFIAGFFALYQIKTNNITNARLKWLEGLKLLIAEFFSEVTDLMLKDALSRAIDLRRQDDPKNEKNNLDYEKLNFEIAGKLHIINLKHDLIKLNLNLKEPLHQRFESELDKYMDLFNNLMAVKGNDYSQLLKDSSSKQDLLMLISRHIIKLEWEKTKRTRLGNWWYIKRKGNKLTKEALNLKSL